MVSTEANVVEPVFSEEDCIDFFFSKKWPNGFRCPQCGHSRYYTIRTRRLPLYQCHNCQHQTTLTVGTVMERSRTPLYKWRIAFHLFSQPEGVSAVHLSEIISVTYKTAWEMLKKLRLALSDKDTQRPLTGRVRAGVSIYGKRTLQPFYRHPKERPVMVSASFQADGQPSYVKLKMIADEHMPGKRTLLYSGEVAFTKQHVQPGTFDVRFLKRS
ncbi:transposase [Paenibacillus alkalitolerans]|uniref:transposase n=1 Tax=Paenibacillus alkalitolerans TaxID=2799335 RepID=UPI0018F473FA|nr:transposase [Paenibacillus alkalitolerans]